MSIVFSAYQEEHFQQLHNAFIDAFSDYLVTFKPDQAAFKRRIYSKLKLNHMLSGLALEDHQVVSFILHTSNTYEGKQTIYNGGTGTRMSYQGMNLAFQLYEYLFPNLKKTGAERILLEVIDKNKRAQRLYENLGFAFTRVMKCFKLTKELDGKPSFAIEQHIEWCERFSENMSFEPCFMDSTPQLVHNLEHEVILEAKVDNQPAGHLIFQPDLGRISQLAVHPKYRHIGVGKSLIIACQQRSRNPFLTILNIPEAEINTLDALAAIGFANEIDQFELELII